MSTTIQPRNSAPMTAWTPTFAMSVDEAVAQVQMKREFFRRCMVEDVHYGTIPGTPKPSLWKPGAEFLLSSMGLHCEVPVKDSVRDYTGRDHNGEPFVEFLCSGVVYRQIGPARDDRMVIAQADGLCNSWETKYRWRSAKPQCPDCHQEAVKFRKDGGAWCDRNSGGCGHSFNKGDERIAGQQLGKVKNPDIADLSNTILKIAGKRAYVASTLLATGCSDIFTQDVVDDDDSDTSVGDNDTPAGTSRSTGRGNGRGGGKPTSLAGASDEQAAELKALNERLGDKRWSPAILNGRASRPDGYTKTKAELEEMLAKEAAPARTVDAETGEIKPAPGANATTEPEQGKML